MGFPGVLEPTLPDESGGDGDDEEDEDDEHAADDGHQTCVYLVVSRDNLALCGKQRENTRVVTR